MRTNIDIDVDLMEQAMRAGHFKTKKDAVEAGLLLLKRQAAYGEILKWDGKLHWDGDEAEPGAELVTGVGRGKRVIATSPAKKTSVAKPRRHGHR